jgi:hypothetical protein
MSIGRGMSGRSAFRGRSTHPGIGNSGRGSITGQLTSMSTNKSDKYVAKKPTNIKSKFNSSPTKKVYFTYTDEFGNNLNDQVYQENVEMEDVDQDIYDQNDENDMDDDEEIM